MFQNYFTRKCYFPLIRVGSWFHRNRLVEEQLVVCVPNRHNVWDWN